MIEMLIVAVLVLWSALVVFKKVFPKTSSSVFSSISIALENKGWNKLATWMRPKQVAGCGGNCGCDAQDEPKKPEIQAVKWK